jgi:chorismate mutase
MTKVRGVRGATTASANERRTIIDATEELLREMAGRNGIDPDDLAAVHFTTSPDLVAEFPAVAARERLGWDYVPLLNSHEMSVPHGQALCIRVLMLWNTEKPQRDIRHVYLRDAVSLRKDLGSTAKQ